MRVTLLLLALLAAAPAWGAKMRVSWVAPTTNTDGSPLTDLAGYRVEWGSCNADGSFGTYQSGINVPATATTAWIYPTGLAKVCAHVFAINAKNILSAASNTASGVPPTPLSQPTH